jgi:ribonuclease D
MSTDITKPIDPTPNSPASPIALIICDHIIPKHIMTHPPPPLYIDESQSLEAFCDSIQPGSVLALDTEFVRERTYFPIFCLLQISVGNQIAFIDPIRLCSLDPLRRVLLNPGILKILHSGRQDLEVIHQAIGVLPTNLIDTQIAAALAGYPDQIGYGRLVLDLFSVQLNKEHTRTDWQQRPLSSEQLRYAADDVAYLSSACHKLQEHLSGRGRLEWLLEDSNALLDPALYENLPQQAWRRLGGVHDTPEPMLNRFKALTAWREETAQRFDLPRNWILKDEDIYSLARMTDHESISIPHIRGLDRREHDRLNHEAAKILESINITESTPYKQHQSDPERKALLKSLSHLVRNVAAELSISPTMLASRRDLELLLDTPEASRITQGWRLDIIGKRLLREVNTALSD